MSTPTPTPEPTPAPTPEPTPTPTPEPTPTPAPSAERPDYLPEKFWKDGAPDVENMAKSYRDLETAFSTRKPVGLPDSPEGYQLKPEALPEGLTWSEDAEKRFAGAFHANGITPDAAKAITQTFIEMEAENQRLIGDAYEKQIQDGTAALKKEWGSNYESKIGQVKSVVASLGYDPADASLFSHPPVVSFLGKVVGMLSEDAVASMRGAVAPGNSFVNGAEEARAIMRDVKHPDYEAYHNGDRTVIAKVKRLIDG